MKISNDKLDFSYKKPPKIIAEISGNHNGNKSRFLKLVKKACESNADFIKIQTYEPVDITVSKKVNYIELKKVYGKENIILIYIEKLAHHMHGIKKHSKLQKNTKKLYLAVHSVLEL